MRMSHLFGLMRLPFLLLTPACVLLGFGTAYWDGVAVNPLYLGLALLGALAAHVSVNVFNEYLDFKSGLDLRTERTPFSGGSGTLPAQPALARAALIIAVSALVLSALIGLYFTVVRGWGLLPLGILGLLVVLAYTPWIARHPLLSLIAPGLAFGPLMVMGTDFVLRGSYAWSAAAASLVPFFLVNNLLLLNQFPDIDADRSVGRRHLPMVLGTRASSRVSVLFMLLAFASIAVSAYEKLLPDASLMALPGLLLALAVGIGVARHAERGTPLMPFLGLNVLVTLATPVLVSLGLFVA